MIIYNQIPKLGDPSNREQKFDALNINILCCRYWWLSNWTSTRMSFPYWRLYWNKTPGAYVETDQRVELVPDKIILIPPFTAFSTKIEHPETNDSINSYLLKGNRLNSLKEEAAYVEEKKVLHLYIHFNLGGLLEHTYRNIYAIELNAYHKSLIDQIRKRLMKEEVDFDSSFSLLIHHLIIASINQIPLKELKEKKIDRRIEQSLVYIDENIHDSITNEQLAVFCNMATNSFARLFHQNLNNSPQQYIQKLRVARASELLDHSNYSTDEIAELVGFSDRSHFSKMFKKHRGVSPSEYKKRFIINQNRS